MAAEVLTLLALKMQEGGLVSGFQATKNGQQIPLLQFTDDTLFFVQGGENMLYNLKGMLIIFQAVSGLQINESKSLLFDMNSCVDRVLVDRMWNCQWSHFPSIYLGVPLGGTFKMKSVWDDLIARIRKRLALWKRMYLSKGGRVVLIKSTLASIPVYLMSLLVMPVSVGEEIEKIARRFLWGTTEGHKKYNLVRWDELCVPMEEGGLGFRRILDFNVALLTKWLWKYAQGGTQLWRRVIKEKYGEQQGGWFSQCTKGLIKYSLWRAILKVKPFFEYCVSFDVGKGSSVQLWHNAWLEGGVLKNQFPALFKRSRKKEGFISEFVRNGEWSFDMSNRLSDMEIEEVTWLLQLLQEVKLTETEDKMMWWSEGKNFSVRNCYNIINQARIVELGLCIGNFPKEKVWKKKTPARANFFTWLLFRRRLLTDERLQEMGTSIVSRCSLCGIERETMDHVFLRCTVSQEAFQSLIWGTQANCSLNSIEECIASWNSSNLTEIGKEYWDLLPHAMFWGIWIVRNSCRFDEETTQGWRLLQRIKNLLWQWGLGNKKLENVRIEHLMFSWKRIMYK